LTVTDKQTTTKELNINHKNTHINTIQRPGVDLPTPERWKAELT